MQNYKNIKAFTLVELSIVLVIIALLVGGVLAGQDVLTATKRNSIITEVQTFRTAIANFRAKYFNNIPGDFDEAETYWTSSLATNGDGDGRIDKTQDDASGESLYIWQHLNLAEMLPGNYTGAMDGSDELVPEENVPGSDYSKDLGYNISWSSTAFDDISSAATPFYNKNVLTAGGCSFQTADTDEYCGGGIISAQDADAIDTKIDDGVGNAGSMVAFDSASATGTCTGTIDTSADYDVSDITKSCVLVFKYKEFN